MIEVSLAWVAQHVDGKLSRGHGNGQDIFINKVNTDTRTIKNGSLFVALIGPNCNAHDFVARAEELGATAIMVSQQVKTDLPTIVVADTTLALGALAAAVKSDVGPKTVGITGSSGKTTVKEMVTSILEQRGKVLATSGNMNNEIGVPLTLLELQKEHEFAVIEMGAKQLGEISYTASLAKPDVATVINASAAHLEGFGSLFGVARAKSEIYSALNDDGMAILNLDSQFSEYWSGKLENTNIETFSMEEVTLPGSEIKLAADYYANDVVLGLDGCAQFDLHTPDGKAGILLSLPGMHNVSNALAAAALAISVGASLENVKAGLQSLSQVKGRLCVKQPSNQVRILDDTYNANVASVQAAVDLLSSFSGYKVVILGDMGELGEKARYYHEKVGEYAYQQGISCFYSLGVLSQSASDVFNERGEHFSEIDSLIQALTLKLVNENQDISILVKGSRSARMERVVAAIERSPVAYFQRTRERIAC